MKKKPSLLTLFMLLAVLILPLSNGRADTTGDPGSFPKEAWNDINDPAVINPNFITTLSSLPTSGKTPMAPWSDSYWPTYQGGIAYRWNMQGPERRKVPFTHSPFRASLVQSMSLSDLAALSPAEKYDIFMGDFSYPTYRRELNRTSPRAQTWEGICHGWSAAATNFQREPGQVVLRGPGGVEVPFSPSDIKALLAYYQGVLTSAPTAFLGSRCEEDRFWHAGGRISSRACRDVNAGSFHVVLANMLGLQKRSFVADLTTGKEVWNFPIYSFNARLVALKNRASRGAARGTVREAEYLTEVLYAVEADPSLARTGAVLDKKTYRYRVELDARDHIIGGEWLQIDRPDFLWVQQRPTFSGYYGAIIKIYEASLNTRFL